MCALVVFGHTRFGPCFAYCRNIDECKSQLGEARNMLDNIDEHKEALKLNANDIFHQDNVDGSNTDNSKIDAMLSALSDLQI